MSHSKIDLSDLDEMVQSAVERFWLTRKSQTSRQGSRSGKKDAGQRQAVTGGKHLDGIVEMIQVLVERHCPGMSVHVQRYGSDPATQLPGYFRPTKFWDLLVKHGDHLAAAIELKSHVGSFGNNYNNRCEESIGTGYDMKVAFREEMFRDSPPPWVGFWMLLQESEKSTRSGQPFRSAHFDVDSEFDGASYAKRYEVTLQRLVHDRLYQNACLILSSSDGQKAEWREPNQLMTARSFVGGLLGHLVGLDAGS